MPKAKKTTKPQTPAPEANPRDNFFYGKLLKPGDFTDEQNYLRPHVDPGNPATPILGVLRAVVINNIDPSFAHRVQIQIPALGQAAGLQLWAPVLQPAGTTEPSIPNPGDEVVVAFENGDPNYPIVIGFLWTMP